MEGVLPIARQDWPELEDTVCPAFITPIYRKGMLNEGLATPKRCITALKEVGVNNGKLGPHGLQQNCLK